jgi:hypothetical protein
LTSLLLVPLVLGAVLLIVAEFLPLYEIRAVTAVPEGGRRSTGAHHGYALLVIGIALLPMAWGAVRGGSRPAAIAALVLSVIALFVALAIDLPDLNETGLIGRTYDQAEARPRVGFFVETLGATLALLGAIGTLVLKPRAR